MITCEICNKEFKNYRGLTSHITQSHKISRQEYYDKYLRKDNDGKCKTCENNTNFKSLKDGYYDFCCNRCVQLNSETQNKIKKTNIKNHGVEHYSKTDEYKEKIKKTSLEKYGEEYYVKTNEFRNKYTKTCLKDYGVESHNQSESVKIKKEQSYLKNYGVKNPSKSEGIKKKKEEKTLKNYRVNNVFQSDEIKLKIKQTNLNNYGVENIQQSEEFKKIRNINMFDKIKGYLKELDLEFLDEKYNGNRESHTFLCLKCNNKFNSCWDYIKQGYQKCPICFPKLNGFSKGEKEISNFLKLYNLNVLENSRQIIKPYELDIYLPEKNIAIEYNGIYWHSELFNIDKDYHLNKTNLCKNKGIRLIHIFEDEWIYKQDIVKERLKSILNLNYDKERIHARKCEIQEIIPKEKNEFLDQYHLQGKDSSTIKLGAFYNNELISVMTFSKSNISRGFYKSEGVWELSRFSTNFNYHIPGIASKLLTYFKRNYKWKEINTFSDNRWSNGNLYYKIGFNYVYDTKPNYWYIKDFKRLHRFNLRKRKDEPKDIPEWLLRLNEGYNKIWDCGNMKFSLSK